MNKEYILRRLKAGFEEVYEGEFDILSEALEKLIIKENFEEGE